MVVLHNTGLYTIGEYSVALGSSSFCLSLPLATPPSAASPCQEGWAGSHWPGTLRHGRSIFHYSYLVGKQNHRGRCLIPYVPWRRLLSRKHASRGHERVRAGRWKSNPGQKQQCRLSRASHVGIKRLAAHHEADEPPSHLGPWRPVAVFFCFFCEVAQARPATV